jgi:hypothetical protein
MLEAIGGLWRLAFDVEDLGAHELVQLGAQRVLVRADDRSQNLVVKFAAQRRRHLRHLAISRHAIQPRQDQIL